MSDIFLSNLEGMPEPPFTQDEEVSPSNPFLEEEETSRRDARPLERALDLLMVTTSRRCPRESDSFFFVFNYCFPTFILLFFIILQKFWFWSLYLIGEPPFSPDMFNITNMRGKVAKFCIFKTVYRLGEDIIGTFNFSEGDIPCLQVSLQSLSQFLYNNGVAVLSACELWFYVCLFMFFSILLAFKVRKRSSNSTSEDPVRLSVWLDMDDTWSPASTLPPATSPCPSPSTSRQVLAQT